MLSYHPLVLYDIKSLLTKSFRSVNSFGERKKMRKKDNNVIAGSLPISLSLIVGKNKCDAPAFFFPSYACITLVFNY